MRHHELTQAHMKRIGDRQPKPTWIVVIAILLIALAWALASHREPSYQGRTVTDWLYGPADVVFMPNDFYGHIQSELWDEVVAGGYAARLTQTNAPPVPYSHPVEDEATKAIQQIGRAAVPRLIDLMRRRRGAGEVLRDKVAGHLPPNLRDVLMNSSIVLDRERCQIAANNGFAILGTNAESALPALYAMLNGPEADFEMGCAINYIGPKGRHLLVQALTSTNSNARDIAAFCLGESPEEGELALPVLLSLVERDAASYQVMGAIGRLGGAADVVVPVLTAYLERAEKEEATDRDLVMAILILGEFGAKAKPCLPVLGRLYPSSDVTTRQVIRVAIHSIDPESERLVGRAWNKLDLEDPWWTGAKQ